MYIWDGDLSNFIVNDCFVINGILLKCFETSGNITVPDGTEEIQRDDDIILNENTFETCDGFEQCKNISSLILSASLKVIGPGTFYTMSLLDRVQFLGTMKDFVSIKGKPYLLLNCPKLQCIECSDGCWTIPNLLAEKKLAAFINDPKRTEVLIAEDLTW